MKIGTVCFDLDGTLIRSTDSVRYVCALSGKVAAFDEIERREASEGLSWIDADYLKARLLKGLPVWEVEAKLRQDITFIKNIGQVLAYLRQRGTKSVLITAGPVQVAAAVGNHFGFDGVYGSLYEVEAQKFTGRITNHLGSNGKLICLRDFCLKNGIGLEHCVAIGNSGSDIGVFKACRRSIAINYSDSLKGEASEYILTDDLYDIVGILEAWLKE